MVENDHTCRVCGTLLTIGENVKPSAFAHGDYICRTCEQEYKREYCLNHREQIRERRSTYYQKHREHTYKWHIEYNHRTGRSQPMNENRECALFLGIHVAERVLKSVFKNVVQMPNGNPGYDFRCAQGYLVDVKSGCRRYTPAGTVYWMFNIKKNLIAEYFLCLAFDNRNDLTPEHIWLIPAGDVNNKTGIGISEKTLDKWDEYKLDLDKVISCCNTMKEASK